MKKRIAVLAGIMVMVMGAVFLGCVPVMASTQTECDEAGSGYCYTISWPQQAGASGGSCEGAVKVIGNYYYCTIDVQTHGSQGNSDGGGRGTDTSGYESSSSGYGTAEGTSTGIVGSQSNVGAATDNGCGGEGVKTNLFGDGCISGEDGIFMVLNVILQVLTWGVGIAGTLGIVITGIQYMTAKDNAAQMEKAKHRLIQIVIGLAVYAVMWAFLQWLLPGGVFGS